jgi:DNA polymerase-3 subunit gamma/tau
VFGAVDRLVEAGHDPRRFAADLLDRLRDLTLLEAVPDAADRGLVDAPGDQLARMVEQAGRLGPATLSRYSEIVHSGLTDMRGTTAPRLLLELVCARMLLPAASDGDAALLQRLERMERRISIAPPPEAPREPTPVAATPAAPPSDSEPRRGAETVPEPVVAPNGAAGARPAAAVAEAPAGETAPAEAPAPGGMDAVAVRRVWSELLAAVRERSRTTEVLLSNATVQAVEGSTLVLTIPSAPLAKRLSEQRNTDVIVAALNAVLGVDWQVRCEHNDGGLDLGTGTAAKSPSTPSPPPRRQPEQQPPPPEPPPVDDDTMLAEAAEPPGEQLPRRDPEEVAMELLTAQLGARELDKG